MNRVDVKTKNRILHLLLEKHYLPRSLCSSLIKLLKKGSLSNATLAAELLQIRIKDYPGFEKRYAVAYSEYKDRLRRKNNIKQHYEKYKVRSNQTLVDKKGKMQRLEKVRQQLKKPIGRIS